MVHSFCVTRITISLYLVFFQQRWTCRRRFKASIARPSCHCMCSNRSGCRNVAERCGMRAHRLQYMTTRARAFAHATSRQRGARYRLWTRSARQHITARRRRTTREGRTRRLAYINCHKKWNISIILAVLRESRFHPPRCSTVFVNKIAVFVVERLLSSERKWNINEFTWKYNSVLYLLDWNSWFCFEVDVKYNFCKSVFLEILLCKKKK